MPNLTNIFNSATLDTAYSWLCKQRRNFPANTVIWHLRFHWYTGRPLLLQTLNKPDYTFLLLSVINQSRW
ncbi:hypothetical protein [Paraglaciecola sp. 25GB23A]|uniref:hypothetical protein n=1 Tax=Paraglaciecola sp. 25GB23A TaxID=3156068 RepID=UPI0032AEB72D